MNTIITLTGPTCSGKSTLAQALKREGVPEVLSFTTRKPRLGEVDGVHYDFVTVDDVEQFRLSDNVVECVEFNGNLYGNTVNRMNQAFDDGNGLAAVVVEPKGVGHWQAAGRKFGFAVKTVYLGQREETLIERMLTRFREDTLTTAAAFRKRFVDMLHIEQATWHLADYDLKLWNLGVDKAITADRAIAAIRNVAIGKAFA